MRDGIETVPFGIPVARLFRETVRICLRYRVTGLAAEAGFFALLSPAIGWLGVAITGSDTSSNALFGLLQATTAQKVGLDPVLMAATNSSAGVLGKMLSPQNLAVAAAAAGMAGKEGDLFRKLLWWSLGLLIVFTGLVYLQSTPILGWMVPTP